MVVLTAKVFGRNSNERTAREKAQVLGRSIDIFSSFVGCPNKWLSQPSAV